MSDLLAATSMLRLVASELGRGWVPMTPHGGGLAPNERSKSLSDLGSWSSVHAGDHAADVLTAQDNERPYWLGFDSAPPLWREGDYRHRRGVAVYGRMERTLEATESMILPKDTVLAAALLEQFISHGDEMLQDCDDEPAGD